MKHKLKILTLFVAILFLSDNNVISQINSYSIDQTITTSSGSVDLDVDSDGNNDYTFQILPLSGNLKAARAISIGNSQIMDGSTFGYPDALNFGDNVAGPFSSGNTVLGTDVGGAGEFSGVGKMYLGLNINIAGESHLGWILIEVAASNDTIVLHGIGYNIVASDGITAGMMNQSSVDEIDLIDFEIYPNPSKHVIKIDWQNLNTEVTYSISDLTGKLMLKGELVNDIDVSGLTFGTYILTIQDGQNIGRKKFLKS